MTVFVFHQDQQGYHYELQSVLPNSSLFKITMKMVELATLFHHSLGLSWRHICLVLVILVQTIWPSLEKMQPHRWPRVTSLWRSVEDLNSQYTTEVRQPTIKRSLIILDAFWRKMMWFKLLSSYLTKKKPEKRRNLICLLYYRKNIFLLYTISDGLHFCTPDLRSIVNLGLRRGQSENFKRGDMFWNSVHKCFKIYF